MKELLENQLLKNDTYQNLCIHLTGAVQGVGFRPFVYQLARTLKLKGWVKNEPSGVLIEVEGPRSELDTFLTSLYQDKPAYSFYQTFDVFYTHPKGHDRFDILDSTSSGEKTTLVIPDMTTCPECLSEIFAPANRRYLYPFTNCTHCGPRYSIIETIPYDRENTTMKIFSMCPLCQKEYEDPLDRRFHAQPNACPDCGPCLELWDHQGKVIATRHAAVLSVKRWIKEGKIVAVKGLGGFQLLCDAENENAVKRLRERKLREEKPFAVMLPTVEDAMKYCHMSVLEKQLLCGPQAPIVLLKKQDFHVWCHCERNEVKRSKPEIFNTRTIKRLRDCFVAKSAPRNDTGKVFNRELAPSVAPHNPYLGVMLPYTPLHHILTRILNCPVVATSGNLTDEPICIDEFDALHRLKGIADIFLVHNRPIARHVDDSVVRVICDKPFMIRRARGFVPLPVETDIDCSGILGVGGHLKNTIAAGVKNNILVSQHIGDLETQQSNHAFKQTIESFQDLYEMDIQTVACDRHPDYLSTRFAKDLQKEIIEIQHHHAHIASAMADNNIQGTVLGVAWDGTGWGPDQTIWGGEFLLAGLFDFKRVAHLRTFRLPGGEKAAKEPRRAALGLLYEMFQENAVHLKHINSIQSFTDAELRVLIKAMRGQINSPVTSSMGRLFDAVSSIMGLYQKTSFEGQAAMGLEFILDDLQSDEFYKFEMHDVKGVYVIDWTLMIRALLDDVALKTSIKEISAKFHNSLVEIIVQMAKCVGEKRVVLSGGCFQNKYLIERSIARLNKEGFKPFWHQKIPTNDGGIALGQVVIAAHRRKVS